MPLSASTATHWVFLQIDLSAPAGQTIECSFFGHFRISFNFKPQTRHSSLDTVYGFRTEDRYTGAKHGAFLLYLGLFACIYA